MTDIVPLNIRKEKDQSCSRL